MKSYLYMLCIAAFGSSALFAMESEAMEHEEAEPEKSQEERVVTAPKTEKSPLYVATERGDVSQVRFLLGRGRVDLEETQTNENLTPLMVALENVKPENKKRDDYYIISKLLLRRGAKPTAQINVFDDKGQQVGQETILEHAINTHVEKRGVELVQKALRGQPIV